MEHIITFGPASSGQRHPLCLLPSISSSFAKMKHVITCSGRFQSAEYKDQFRMVAKWS
jgi:hypothetical protein